EKSLRGRDAAGDQVAEMLMRGCSRLNRTQIADRFDQLKAQVQVSGDAEGVTFSGETTREKLPEVLKLAVEVLRSPTFPASEFEALRQEALSAIEQQRSEPRAVGQLAFQRALSPYPKGHPRYVPSLEEQLTELRQLRLEDLKAFHHDFYGASAGEISLVGDLDPKATQLLVTKYFGHWQSLRPYERMPRLHKPTQGSHLSLETPDKANAFFMAGQTLALRDNDPDFPALLMGNFMLGGGFLNSRLATRIRQKEGLSYGVGSMLQAQAQDSAGAWIAYAIYSPQNATRLEAAFQEELAKVLKDGFTQEELDAARKGWLQSQQVSRAQDRELCARLANHLEAGRTLAYNESLEAKVRALTPEQVRSALRRYLDPAKLVLVKAGDFSGKR
ncbi:MAG: peptidase domain protein, partial [Holophagaceae bacterium]|nr:peptidase domain protein [Holophagaceae bacterium]